MAEEIIRSKLRDKIEQRASARLRETKREEFKSEEDPALEIESIEDDERMAIVQQKFI